MCRDCPGVYCESPTTEKINQLRSVHDHQMKKLLRFLHDGICEHIYLDMGTNIGVQIRKLYQPEGYPTAKVLPYFDKFYGKVSKTFRRKNVCAIGFEANEVHTSHLIKLQDSYNKVGYPVVIFTDAAVSTEPGTIKFFHDQNAKPEFHEWGASAFHEMTANGNFSLSLAIDIDHFLHNVKSHWIKSSSYNGNHSVMFAKMDIVASYDRSWKPLYFIWDYC